MPTLAFDLYPRKCKECGKRFESCVDYAYKLERQKGKPIYWWFCSWKCLQAYRAKKGGMNIDKDIDCRAVL